MYNRAAVCCELRKRRSVLIEQGLAYVPKSTVTDMPSLFVMPSVQTRLQASIHPSAAKPRAPPVVRPLASSGSKRAQRQIHVCHATGKNEPNYDENDYITAGIDIGACRVGSGLLPNSILHRPGALTPWVTCSSCTSCQRSRYNSEGRLEGYHTAGVCWCALSSKAVARGIPASRPQTYT